MNRSHPLRRPSTGSLSGLARSTDRNTTSPSGLDFLQPALAELNDEASTLAINIAHLTELHDALGTFNESFAGYLYALKMNAFCVEWEQGPNEFSFSRLEGFEKQIHDAQIAMQLAAQQEQERLVAAQRAASPTPPQQTATGDMTYATAYSSDDVRAPPAAKGRTVSAAAGKKPVAAAAAATGKKQLLAQKKKRELEISGIIDTLPLEYRGNQPDLRRAMEEVISHLMDAPDGLPLKALVSPPLIPQPRANKCLIALVTKKLVVKNNVGGTAFYQWVGA